MTDFLAFAAAMSSCSTAPWAASSARDLTLDDYWGQENCSEIPNLSAPT